MPQGVRMIIITGLSGAGKTVAVQSLEDLGFFCIDNLPPALIGKFSELARQSGESLRRVALVCDLRGGEFFNALFDSLNELDEAQIDYEIVFLEADDETLVRRYKASRRRHPHAPVSGRVLDGVEREREQLATVRGRADLILNTSRMKPVELKEAFVNRFFHVSEYDQLSVTIISFGFKYGLPIDADLVFDVRFLPNPYYVDALRVRTGQNQEVYDYVMKWPATQEFLTKLMDMIDFLIPQYAREGKAQIVVGIGCTGGRHRSVAIAERLREHLQTNYAVAVAHRDVGKDGER